MSNGPSALLRAMSLSNGSWTFYEGINLLMENYQHSGGGFKERFEKPESITFPVGLQL
jgi:hypothetical protein